MSDARAVLDEQMTEADLQDAVLELAKLRKWLAYHTHDSRRSHAGFPDLVLVRGERLIFVELKRERRSYASIAQRIWLEALKVVAGVAPNVEVYLWRPSDWPERIAEVLARG